MRIMSHTVKFTETQLQELRYKLDIVAEERDLLESYELSSEEVTALVELVDVAWRNRAPLTFEDRFFDVIEGELEDALQIAKDNLEDGDNDWRGAVVSYSNALKKLSNLERNAS